MGGSAGKDRPQGTLGLALVLILSACCYARTYSGDGAFSDSCDTGSWLSWDRSRYELDLGELDLAKSGEYRFQVGSLPRARMWMIGLVVYPRDDRPPQALLDQAVVEMVMKNRERELVIDEAKPLHLWTWWLSAESQQGIGPSFVYLGGDRREIPLAGGDHREEPVLNAEGGWGTYFDPVRGSSYDLTVRILTPDVDATHFDVRLRAIGSNYGGSL